MPGSHVPRIGDEAEAWVIDEACRKLRDAALAPSHTRAASVDELEMRMLEQIDDVSAQPVRGGRSEWFDLGLAAR